MNKYYAGIGSRDIPNDVFLKMKNIAKLLEEKGYILRSGGANGADTAFENGVSNKKNMNIFLPFSEFNGRKEDNVSYIYIDQNDYENYDEAYQSLKYHPSKFNMRFSAKSMMIRNYFQHSGLKGEPKSDFIICYTKDSANGTTIPTSRDTGGTGQAIRIAAENNTPVYNLKDDSYQKMQSEDIVNLILSNLHDNINPHEVKLSNNTTNLF